MVRMAGREGEGQPSDPCLMQAPCQGSRSADPLAPVRGSHLWATRADGVRSWDTQETRWGSGIPAPPVLQSRLPIRPGI